MPNEAPPETIAMWHKNTGNRAVVNVADVKDWKVRGYSTSEPKLPSAPAKPAEGAPANGSSAGAQ